jgi:hypothetical protein
MPEPSLYKKGKSTPRWGLSRAAFDLENIKAFAPGDWQELSTSDFSLTTSELRIVLSVTRFNRYAAFVYIIEPAMMGPSEPVLWFHKENLDWRQSLYSVIAGVRDGIAGFPEVPEGPPEIALQKEEANNKAS